jgi:hypothetical protein
MGRGPSFWFPPALLGFTEIGLAVAHLPACRSGAEAGSANLLVGPPRVPDGATVYSQAEFRPLDEFFELRRGLPGGLAWLVAFALVAVVLSADVVGMPASAVILLGAAFTALLRGKPHSIS